MQALMPLLVVSVLLLVPLVPAAILYKVLTPASSRTGKGGSTAGGAFDGGNLGLPGMRLKFNVVGSTATYIVLLAISIFVYMRLDETATAREAMKDDAVWRINVPVRLRSVDGKTVPAANGELQMVQVVLEPASTQADAKQLSLRVWPESARFPTVRLSIPSVGTSPALVDLNDSTMFVRDYRTRELKGVRPIWITVGNPYSAAPSAPPVTSGGAP